ncbi:ankyrin repeat protein, putative [Trichomonas vaginalis G3]|uniref:Ankyrin repeat protein, putative n=1 Tax=Trichomonas vaginalis (strain ATCC PRA-98 / G3) TaxID=412133 RepID=A2EGG5_TRIV3|nr:spectrin binding [Trichomonas vaginalis G3]EAY08248.1 ankyrin repeat protein, putative [Trichomonas vaginalis G3]KAI5507514.1 spectrin binding [Trichomonas vaginalis G3]|eukprot:XP_001320471.1 ankyrin repeat protein [Trichomonas vaginalis G3]
MLIILLFQLRKLSQGIALHDAVKKNQTDIVLDLISNGVEIDGHSLNIAISSNNTNMVDLLVTHGADAKYIDKNQQLSMIHIACMLNNIKAVDILISHGANVNDQNSLYRYSPLIFASMFNYKEIAELLISHGANVNLGDFRGNTPIHHILFFGDETIMEAIVNSYSQIFNEDFINSFDIHKKKQ